MGGGKALQWEQTSLEVTVYEFTSLVCYYTAIFFSILFLITLTIWHEMHSLMHFNLVNNHS
jgi:hypothetical protein